MAQAGGDVVKHVPQANMNICWILMEKESTRWHIASQAVKRKTCHCVGRTRTVTSPHVWPSTPHWEVERVIVKARKPGPTHPCLRIHVWAKRQDKKRLWFVLSVFECEEKLGAHNA